MSLHHLDAGTHVERPVEGSLVGRTIRRMIESARRNPETLLGGVIIVGISAIAAYDLSGGFDQWRRERAKQEAPAAKPPPPRSVDEGMGTARFFMDAPFKRRVRDDTEESDSEF